MTSARFTSALWADVDAPVRHCAMAALLLTLGRRWMQLMHPFEFWTARRWKRTYASVALGFIRGAVE